MSRVGPEATRAGIGVVVLVLLTLYFTTAQATFTVLVYNSWLLASMGAVALALLTGMGGQLSLGNSAFMIVGAFGSVFLSAQGLPFPLDVACAAIGAGIAGFIVGLPAARLRGLYLALATVAAYFIFLYVAKRYQQAEVGSAGFRLEPVFAGGGLADQQESWAWLLTAVLAVVIVFAAALRSSKTGRAWRIVRDHELISSTLGIRATLYKLGLFVVTSAIIGMQGGLQAHYHGTVTIESFTLLLAVSYLAMIYIGGATTLIGPLVGAGVVIALPFAAPSIVRAVGGDVGGNSAQLAKIIYGVLIVIFITRARGGLIGWVEDLVRIVSRRLGPPRRVRFRATSDREH